MFKQQPGCMGVFFLRSERTCSALSFWVDLASVEMLKTSPSYNEASDFYDQSGMSSVVTLKPAIRGHFKTGHREVLRHIW